MLKRFFDMRNPETHHSPFSYSWAATRPHERVPYTEYVAESWRLDREPLFMLRLAEIIGSTNFTKTDSSFG